MSRVPWSIVAVILSSAACVAAVAVADEPQVIPADQARAHLEKQAIVEMTVRSSKHAVPRRVTYLDSEADFKSPKNVAVLIPDSALPRFAEAGVADPAAHYKGRTIRVSGKITLFRELDAVRIEVTDPGQITGVQP